VKNQPPPPPEHGAGLSFPAFGFRIPKQKGWTWTGLELEQKKTKAALGSETKKEEAKPLPHLKWPGVGQNELAGGPKVLLTAAFLADNCCPIFFAPAFI
jgi:hypothetical protein